MEELVTIKGFEQYEINRNGDIYFKGNKHIHRHKKKATVANNGYYVVNLWDGNNHSKVVCLHRLLALMFIPNKDNKPFVNHIDGNKLNNSLSNLEWCTNQENVTHARKTGLTHDNKSVRCLENGKIYYSQSQASRDLFGNVKRQSDISAQLRGIRNHVGGYHFELIEKGGVYEEP